MRLKAREDLTYAGQEIQAGFIFDATDADGHDLINQDLAVPFNLEDPQDRPDEADLPDEAPAWEEPDPEPGPQPPKPRPEPEKQQPWTRKSSR